MVVKRKRLNGSNGSIGNVPIVNTTRSHLAPIVVSKYPNIARRRMKMEKALEEINLSLLERLAMLGLPDKDIAQALNITPTKFSRYKKRYSPIRVVLKKGQVIASSHVVRSLYKKANGFSVPEEKLFYSAKNNRVIRAKTRKYFAPDTVAQIFWLKNHFPDFWRDRKEIENTGNIGAIQSVKFILVQSGEPGKKSEKVIDGDFRILAGAGQEGREQQAKSSSVSDEK